MTGFNYLFQRVDGAHELYIYDDIREYGDFNWQTWSYDESETSAKHFRDLLAEIPDEDPITVYINSRGGDVYQAAAIASQLRRHKGTVTTVVDGASHSAAFTILQAGDHRVMNKGTSAIIHNMWTYAAGNAKELREIADALDVAMEGEIQYYLERAKISRKELISLLDAETTLTPEKALEYGFIDEIAEPARGEAASAATGSAVLQKAFNPLKNNGETDVIHESDSNPLKMITREEISQMIQAAIEEYSSNPLKNDSESNVIHDSNPNPLKKANDIGEKGVGFNAFFHN